MDGWRGWQWCMCLGQEDIWLFQIWSHQQWSENFVKDVSESWFCSLNCVCKYHKMLKMTGGTPEVSSDKSLTLLSFDIWHLNIWTFEHWNIGTLEHWKIWHSISINQYLVTSIALILFKRLRVTLVTSIASRDWVKIWKSGWIYIYIYIYNRPSSVQELLSELTIGHGLYQWLWSGKANLFRLGGMNRVINEQ